MSLGIPNFTTEMLKTPEGLSELNRIFNLINDNVVGNTTNVRVFNGFGSPENVIAAGIGSLFQRFDGGTGSTIYIKESGTLATGWVAIAQLGTPVSLADGGTGAVLVDPGEDSIFLWDDSAGAVVFRTSKNIQIFTSSGTFTVPNGITKVYLTMLSGGGGGGQGASDDGGGGGQGGNTLINFSLTVTPAANLTVTVGAGGANNTPGEDTVFDSVTVVGGIEGDSFSDGGSGGSPTSTLNGTDGDAAGLGGTQVGILGGTGGDGGPPTNNGGGGGATPFGDGGVGGIDNGRVPGAGAANTGGGGGGGDATSSGRAGAAGGSGIVIVMY